MNDLLFFCRESSAWCGLPDDRTLPSNEPVWPTAGRRPS